MPRLEELWRKYKDEGLSVIAMETSADNERALVFIGEKDLTFHLLINEAEQGNNVVYGTLGVWGLPTTYMIDRDGRLMHIHVGYLVGDEKRSEEEIMHLL